MTIPTTEQDRRSNGSRRMAHQAGSVFVTSVYLLRLRQRGRGRENWPFGHPRGHEPSGRPKVNRVSVAASYLVPVIQTFGQRLAGLGKRQERPAAHKSKGPLTTPPRGSTLARWIQ